MKVKNINSASKKTNQKIKEAFAILMQEKKSLNNITVTELVKKAEITRSSFYTHFESIYDVAQSLQDETLNVLINNIKDIESLDGFDKCVDIIFKYLEENEHIYRMMLSSNDPLLFLSRLNKFFNNYTKEFLTKDNDSDLSLSITFFTDGCMDLIVKYFRKDINYSLDDIKKYIKSLFRKIFL